MNAIVALLRMPWWGFLILAALVVGAAEFFYKEEQDLQQRYTAALAQPAPPLVDLNSFDRDADRSDVGEVNVSGWVNFEQSYELVKKTNGVTKSRRFMYLMYGPQDGADTKTVRAAIIMTPAEEEAYADLLWQLSAFNLSELAVGDVMPEHSALRSLPLGLSINGKASRSDGFSKLAYGSMEELGVKAGPEFVFLKPFWQGREAGLTRANTPEDVRLIGWQIAAAIAVFGLIKLVLRRRKLAKTAPVEGAAADPFANSPIATPDAKLGRRTARRRQQPEQSEVRPELRPEMQAPQHSQVTQPHITPPRSRSEAYQGFQYASAQPKPGAALAPKKLIYLVIAVLFGLGILSEFVPGAMFVAVMMSPVILMWIGIFTLQRMLGQGLARLFSRKPQAVDPFDRLRPAK